MSVADDATGGRQLRARGRATRARQSRFSTRESTCLSRVGGTRSHGSPRVTRAGLFSLIASRARSKRRTPRRRGRPRDRPGIRRGWPHRVCSHHEPCSPCRRCRRRSPRTGGGRDRGRTGSRRCARPRCRGVVIGTRFIASVEANAHPVYRRLVVAADETDSVLTDVFEIGWPGRPHRVLRNSTTDLWDCELEPRVRPSQRPAEIVARRRNGDGVEELPRYWVDSPTAEVLEGAEAMALYAGPSAGLVTTVAPAGTIVASIMADAARVLAALPR